jgi:hypothetical protein
MGCDKLANYTACNDYAGYAKPPFTSLLCGEQAENPGDRNCRKVDRLSPIRKWRDEDASEQKRTGDT